MSKQFTKLAMAITGLLVAFVLVIVSSYAWLTMSKSPVADGIQITIGGGSTIMLAPDISVEQDGTIYHYPGVFRKDMLKLSDSISAENLSGLTPVSTVDGLHWFLPTYYTAEDEEVINHTAQLGALKPVADFQVDQKLQYANLADGMETEQGSYLYVDFWVVSPGVDYDLRVATSAETGLGSYVVDLQDVVAEQHEDGTIGYVLRDVEGAAASSYVRIGFLTNTDTAPEQAHLLYRASRDASNLYDNLRGIYQEKGTDADELRGLCNSFYIYEPNGDLHVYDTELGKSYVLTEPVGYVGDTVGNVDIKDILSVQLTNRWSDNAQIALETATINKAFATAKEAQDYFYHQFLQGQTATYITKGQFIKNTAALYRASSNEAVTAEVLASLEQGGACESARIVQLEQNVPQRIRLFIWLEGADVDCVSGTTVTDISMSLELSGSNR